MCRAKTGTSSKAKGSPTPNGSPGCSLAAQEQLPAASPSDHSPTPSQLSPTNGSAEPVSARQRMLHCRSMRFVEREIVYEKLPPDIADRFVLLMDPILASGTSAARAIQVSALDLTHSHLPKIVASSYARVHCCQAACRCFWTMGCWRSAFYFSRL